MKKIVFFLLFVNFAQAQFGSGNIKLENYNKTNFLTNLSKAGEGKLNNSIDGSPFLFSDDDISNFVITATDKNEFTLKSLNYDLRTNSLFVAANKDSIMEFKSDLVDHLMVDNKKFQFFIINEVKKLSEVLFKSDKILFVNGFYLGITKEKIDPMTKLVTTGKKYFKEDRFYLKINNNDFVEVKLKEKPILKLFSDKSNLIKGYANENNLDFAKSGDVVKILTYYESL
ncbi:MAG: hypothetical protein V4670_09205 [Bacteroidota bacterium]